MIALLMLPVLILLGLVLVWWLRKPSADPRRAHPVIKALEHGQDLLPGSDEGEDGLAAFYAYQMAAGKIDRLQ
jgi:hypothetical protein